MLDRIMKELLADWMGIELEQAAIHDLSMLWSGKRLLDYTGALKRLRDAGLCCVEQRELGDVTILTQKGVDMLIELIDQGLEEEKGGAGTEY